MEDLIRPFAALLIVVGAIFGLAWVLRRLSSGRAGASRRLSDLRVVEWRGLDARRKLAVVRWDGREHLLCLGPAGDTLLSSRDAPVEDAAPIAPDAPVPTSLLGRLQSLVTSKTRKEDV